MFSILKYKNKKAVVTALFLLSIVSMKTNISAKELVLPGSTTVQKVILEPAAQAIEKATGITVKVLGINSGKGFKMLLEGKVEASISSSPLSSLLEKEGLPNDGTYKEHVLKIDEIVPIVNKANPVSELTWQKLSDINTGKITNWKDAGGDDKAIIVVTSQPTAATRTVFQEKVMNGEPYVKGAREVNSTREELDMVEKLIGGIGATSEDFVSMNIGKVKVLKLEKKIERPLSIITKGEPSADVKKLIDFLKTSDAQKLFK